MVCLHSITSLFLLSTDINKEDMHRVCYAPAYKYYLDPALIEFHTGGSAASASTSAAADVTDGADGNTNEEGVGNDNGDTDSTASVVEADGTKQEEVAPKENEATTTAGGCGGVIQTLKKCTKKAPVLGIEVH